MEQLAPGSSVFMSNVRINSFQQFNENIAILANNLSNNKSKVIPVDMTADWQDSFLIGDLYYNPDGAKFVADKYFNAIDAHLQN